MTTPASTLSTPALEHLAEALRAHRNHVGLPRVPSDLMGFEESVLVELAERLAVARGERPQRVRANRPSDGVRGSSRDDAPNTHGGELVGASLVGLPEVARMIGISERNLRRRAASGKTPAVLDGSRWKFRPDDIERMRKETSS